MAVLLPLKGGFSQTEHEVRRGRGAVLSRKIYILICHMCSEIINMVRDNVSHTGYVCCMYVLTNYWSYNHYMAIQNLSEHNEIANGYPKHF